jgi:hypothetical protein
MMSRGICYLGMQTIPPPMLPDVDGIRSLLLLVIQCIVHTSRCRFRCWCRWVYATSLFYVITIIMERGPGFKLASACVCHMPVLCTCFTAFSTIRIMRTCDEVPRAMNHMYLGARKALNELAHFDCRTNFSVPYKHRVPIFRVQCTG